jgi:hypothetical protein
MGDSSVRWMSLGCGPAPHPGPAAVDEEPLGAVRIARSWLGRGFLNASSRTYLILDEIVKNQVS